MYVQRNNDACSCNHCCCGKAKSITYCEWVFVALGIQHEMRMPNMWPVQLYDIVPHYLTKGTIFEKKKGH
jgi:hypothetical protein